MPLDLLWTNRFLGLIAVASLLESIAIAAVGVGLFLVSRQLSHLIKTVEEQQLAPAASRVHAILDDVRDVTSVASRFFGRFGRRERQY